VPSTRAVSARRVVALLAALVVLVAVGACQQASRTAPSASTTAGADAPPAAAATGEPRRIGVLVPLTGRAGDVGRDLARATEMALLERGDDDVELIPRDTESTAEGAILAARELVEVHDVDVILGPLFGSHAERVAAIARPRDVVVLAFSNQSEIAGAGLFVLGYRPEEQVERVVGYAVDRGLARIAALAPDDAYGRRAVASLESAVTGALGADLVGTEFYGSDAIDAGGRIDALRGTADGDALPSFDALLIADGGQRLRQVAQLLPRHGVEPVDVRMLGTRLWADAPEVLREPALRGGWYAGVPERTLGDFTSRFRDLFGRAPHPLAILAYDGLLVAEDAAEEPATAIQRITEARGYQGEAGIFRLLPDGRTEHALAIFELTAGGPVVIDPAPLRFTDEPS
jgi:ABC-type branched-subunit amino acid transport system substrate-binding protein